jgi:hypothetical protein
MADDKGLELQDFNESDRSLAQEILEAYNSLSPLIERFTSEVCPTCESVCCIDRHGTHEEEDARFILLLGESPPPEGPKDDDTAPCRHLSPAGCGIPRWQRPFRCTWYFCDPLLEAMPRMEARAYRRFLGDLQRLVELRRQFIYSLQD